MSIKTRTIPILEEYIKINNIEYDFFLTTEYGTNIDSIFEVIKNGKRKYFIKRKRAFISMVDSNNHTLQFEEVNWDYCLTEDVIPIVKRLIRQQKLKELGI